MPFRIVGTVLPQVLPLALLAAAVGAVAVYFELQIVDDAHRMMGFVVGFLFIVMANFSHSNYDKAITAINQMVMDGITVCCEVLPCIGKGDSNDLAAAIERKEFQ